MVNGQHESSCIFHLVARSEPEHSPRNSLSKATQKLSTGRRRPGLSPQERHSIKARETVDSQHILYRPPANPRDATTRSTLLLELRKPRTATRVRCVSERPATGPTAHTTPHHHRPASTSQGRREPDRRNESILRPPTSSRRAT